MARWLVAALLMAGGVALGSSWLAGAGGGSDVAEADAVASVIDTGEEPGLREGGER